MNKKPRILYWDIETTPNLVASFSLLNFNMLPHDSVVKERAIICAAWKWDGEKEVHAVSVLDDAKRFKKDPLDDYHVIKTMADILAEADLLVYHNGRAFDKKWLNTRMLHHGLKPLPPIAEVDTMLVAKKVFYFNSNKMDYIANFLGVGKKLKTDFELWMRVLRGERKAIEEMVTYNKHDVTVLQGVFLKIRPWIPDYLNRQLFGHLGCPFCGSMHTQSRGEHHAKTRVYKRFQCQACGGWFKDTKGFGAVKTRVL